MAGVIGPSKYLPGQFIKAREGAVCDEHPDRPATYTMIGETDSFGSETHDMCDECKQHAISEKEKDVNAEGLCEICHTMQKGVNEARDPSEGMYGPVYRMCPACKNKIINAFLDDDEYYRLSGSDGDDRDYIIGWGDVVDDLDLEIPPEGPDGESDCDPNQDAVNDQITADYNEAVENGEL